MKSDGPRVIMLEKGLSNMHQHNQSITTLYNMFKRPWDKYCLLRAPPAYDCGKCSCLVTHISTKVEKDSSIKFLLGLDDSYVSLRSQILMMSPIPLLSRIYSMLLQEESQRTMNQGVESLVMVTTANFRSTFPPATAQDRRWDTLKCK